MISRNGSPRAVRTAKAMIRIANMTSAAWPRRRAAKPKPAPNAFIGALARTSRCVAGQSKGDYGGDRGLPRHEQERDRVQVRGGIEKESKESAGYDDRHPGSGAPDRLRGDARAEGDKPRSDSASNEARQHPPDNLSACLGARFRAEQFGTHNRRKYVVGRVGGDQPANDREGDRKQAFADIPADPKP